MFNIPNLLTGCNLLFGTVSIILTFSGRIELAVLAIFAGAICDFFDGFAARLLKKQGELGKQLDSLADIITFGVAPGMIVFVLLILSGAWDILLSQDLSLDEMWLDGTMGYSIQHWITVYFNDLVGNQSPFYLSHFYGWYLVLPFGALFIPFMSMFRLAKFNLDTRQAEHFIGLPTPANGIFFASFALLIWDGFGSSDWRTSLSMTLIKDQVLMTFVIVFSVLLVSEFSLFSLKFKSLKWKGNQVRYVFIVSSIILFSLLYVWSIPLIILLYLLLAMVTNKVAKISE